jgi:hypothetical protein
MKLIITTLYTRYLRALHKAQEARCREEALHRYAMIRADMGYTSEDR